MRDEIAVPGGFAWLPRWVAAPGSQRARNTLVRDAQQGHNPPLDRLLDRERVAEILGILTAAELVVALLRAEGMSDAEIGEFLAIERWVVRQRMIRARARIEQIGPGTARMLKGRRR